MRHWHTPVVENNPLGFLFLCKHLIFNVIMIILFNNKRIYSMRQTLLHSTVFLKSCTLAKDTLLFGSTALVIPFCYAQVYQCIGS